MMAVSIGTIMLYTLAVSALALSFGVFYPQFGTENAAQIPTSFGGLVYMMASLCLLAVVIMIEARAGDCEQLRPGSAAEALGPSTALAPVRRGGRHRA